MSEERLQRVAEFAAQLSPPRSAGISSFVGQYFFFQIDFLMTMIFYFLIYKLLDWKLVLMNSIHMINLWKASILSDSSEK